MVGISPLLLPDMDKHKIDVKLGDITVPAILDSGPSVSIISLKVFNQSGLWRYCPTQQSDILSLKGIGQKLVPVLGQVSIAVEIGNKTFPIILHVVQELISPMFLGLDFLTRHSVVMDFKTRTVLLHEGEVSVPMGQNESNTSYRQKQTLNSVETQPVQEFPVRTRSTVNLPPRSEIIIPVYLATHLTESDIGLCEPCSLLKDKEEIMGSRCLISAPQGKAMYKVMNPNNFEVTLPNGTQVATCSFIDSKSITNIEVGKRGHTTAPRCQKRMLKLDLKN